MCSNSKVEAKKDTSKYREWIKTKEIHPLKYDEQLLLDFDIDGAGEDYYNELFMEENELHCQELLNSLRRHPKQNLK